MTDRPAPSAARQKALSVVAALLGSDGAALPPDCSMLTWPKWDSYAHLEIMLFLNREHGVELSEENIMRFSTLSSILEILENGF